MMLPHGYEGQGPEHSSARLERYMQLSAEFNWKSASLQRRADLPLLRRQMLRKQRKPLIIMTPKSLLRHKDAVSFARRAGQGHLPDRHREVDELDPRRSSAWSLCAGKIYYDLLAATA
jgi:2-oxoglutarate dehydrogenase E1 component